MAAPSYSVLTDKDAVTGQMYNAQQTVGQNSKDPANRWHQFFGPPAGEIRTNPYDKYQYETYTLPDAYVGKNIYIRDTIEGFIEGANNWYTTVALPITVTDDIHISWNEWHFDQALASVVPEEGISRLITSSKRGQQDHTIRHGLAFVLEHGFMNTDEGRRQYLLNIQQIAQSVNETNNYDVLSTLLNCREYEREWEKRHSIIRTPWTDIGRREVMEFAIVQKDPRGFEMLHEKYKHRLNRWGVEPNMWVFPPGMALYAAFNPVVSDYNKEGSSVTLSTGPEALGTFRGTSVYETREFDVRNGELPINLLQRRVQIGEHYFMRNHHNDQHKFDSETSMSIVVYDERKDDWAKISYSEALNHAVKLRFDDNGDVDDNNGMGPQGVDVFGFRDSDFSGDEQYQTCSFFGQMEQGAEGTNTPDHLPMEALRAFCDSAEKRINLDKEQIKKAIEALKALDAGNNLIDNTAAAATNVLGQKLAQLFPDLFEADGKVKKLDTGDSSYFNQNNNFINIIMPRPLVFTKDNKFTPEDLNKAIQAVDPNANVKTLGLQNNEDYKAAYDLLVRFTVKKSQLPDLKKHKNWNDALKAAKQQTTNSGSWEQVGYASRGYIENNGDAFVVFPHSENNYSLAPVQIKEVRAKLLEFYPAFGNIHREGTLRRNGIVTAVISDKFSLSGKRLASGSVDAWSKRQALSDPAPVGPAADFAQSYIGSRRTQQASDPDGFNFADYNMNFTTTYRNFTVNRKHLAFAQKVATLSSSLQRIIAYCLYHTPVKRSALMTWRNLNIVPPVSILIARPYMTYDMCSCIMMRGGSETGQTFQGHSDFQLGDDVQSKIHYGNYTYYSKAVVTNPKNIIHARNVFANGYHGGNDTDWIDIDPNTGHVKSGSMFAFIVPYDEHKKENPMRLFNRAEYGTDRPDHKFGRTMTGADYYSARLRITGLQPEEQFTTLSERNDTNDVTYTGHHFWWKEHREGGSTGSYTGCTHNTGHWGRDVYPGCGRVRNGEEVYLEKQHHGQEVY